MTTTDDLARRLQAAMIAAPYKDWRKMYAGRKTDTGITLAGADTNKSWVRAEEDSREETQVWGTVTRPNLPVWVGPNITGELEIKSLEQTEAALTAGAFAAGSLLPPITPDNNQSLLIGGRQFKPGRMRLSDLGGLYVYVEPFHYDGGWWPGGSIELTPTATASKQGWVAVALNPADGALYEFAGADFPTTVVMSENDLGTIAITAGYVPVGAVVLQNGQTTITGTETWADFHYHYAQAGGDISGVPILAPASDTRNTIQPAGDHPALILKNNASQTDNPFQAQTSAGAVNVAITPLGGLTVNEQGADADTRIEGDTDANLLFVDASTDRVGIGTNAPSAKLNVEGAAIFNDAGADVDFRVEGDTRANLLFVDASLDAVGINQATIAASAQLDIASTTKGLLIPRMTTTERDAIGTPATGLMIYNTTTSAFNFYNGSSWAAVGSGAATITVKEVDGTPNVSGVSTVRVSNGTLTDDGGGQVTISTGGSFTPSTAETDYYKRRCALLEPLAIEPLQVDSFSYAVNSSTTKLLVASYQTRLGSIGRMEVRNPAMGALALRDVTLAGTGTGSTAVLIDPTLPTYTNARETYFERINTLSTSSLKYLGFDNDQETKAFLPGAYGAIILQVTTFDLTWTIFQLNGKGWNTANEIGDTGSSDYQRVGNKLQLPVSKYVVCEAVTGQERTSGVGRAGIVYYLLPSTWGAVTDSTTYDFRDDFMGTSLDTATDWNRTQSTAGNVEIDTQYQWLKMKGDGATWGANGLYSQTSVARAAGKIFLCDVYVGRAGNPNLMVGWHDGGGYSFTDMAHAVYFTVSGGNAIQVFENGTSRGTVGSGWTAGYMYRVRITLTTTGATYEIQGGGYGAIGSSSWTTITPGTTSSSTDPLHAGATIYSNVSDCYVGDIRLY